MNVYADSSFFVSIYLEDSHTSGALGRLSRRPRIWFTPFHEAEIVNAVAQQVFRGRISEDHATRTYERLSHHLSNGVWLATEFPESAFHKSSALARKHVSRLGTRTLDTLHVASALELNAQHFWTFDTRQAELAKAAGLKVS